MRVCALVLAAGAARRAGGVNKLLVEGGDRRAMILHTLAVALDSRASEVALVLGHDRAAIAACVRGAGRDDASLDDASLGNDRGRLHLLEAPDHAEGIAGSLRCGVAWADRQGCDGVLVCLGDMPLVRSATLDRLLACLQADDTALACVPTSDGIAGNPVLWRRTLFGSLLALSGDRGGKKLLARHGSEVRRVAVEDRGILEDFDTPERLAAWRL